MKCPHCGESIFPGQFRCDHCNQIVALAPKKEDDKSKKEKSKKEK